MTDGRLHPGITAARFALAWLVLALLALSAAARGESSDEHFLEGLRERRLFSLAELYCLQRLEDTDLGQQRQAELVVELSRCYTEHALHTPPSEADPLWDQALEVTNGFARQHAASPWLVLVKSQAGLVLLVRGESWRFQSEVTTDNQQALEQARNFLRMAIRQLTEVDQQVAELLRGPLKPPSDLQLSRDELLSLQRHVRQQLARAQRNRGQCYPPGSPDRADGLSQAVSLLRPLAKLDTSDPLAWQCRLEEITCHRLLGDKGAVARQIKSLVDEPDLPPRVLLRARGEYIRLALAEDDLPTALETLKTGRLIDGMASAELDLAWLETFLAAWKRASGMKDQQAAGGWESQCSDLLAEVQRRHGPYWTRRAEALLAGHISTSAPGSDLDVLVRAAEAYYRNGQIADAAAAYDRAAQQAHTAGRPDQAFQLRFTAATLYHQRKEFPEALDRYRKLALSMPKHRRAGEAHLLAVFNASQEARRHQPVSLTEYTMLLQEHFQHWPSGESADRAAWMLARVREHERDWPAAIAAYERISPSDAKYAAALTAMADCYRHLLAQPRPEGPTDHELASQAARFFEQRCLTSDGRLPERWSAAQRVASLEASRMWQAAKPPDRRRAEQLLTAALSDVSGADQTWQTAATATLISALAGQGRYDDARGRLAGLASGDPADLLVTLADLAGVAASAPASPAELSALRLEIAKQIEPRRQLLSEVDRNRFDRLHAGVLMDAGREPEAVSLLKKLATENPRDAELQEAYALALSTSDDRTSLDAALKKWRELEQRSRTATPRWFRAKYHLARVHEQLGNKSQAAKIVTVTRVLHPDLGGPELKRQFQELLARCQK